MPHNLEAIIDIMVHLVLEDHKKSNSKDEIRFIGIHPELVYSFIHNLNQLSKITCPIRDKDKIKLEYFIPRPEKKYKEK